MTRFRGIKGRLGRAEAAGEGDTAPVPHILFVRHGETRDTALARFHAEHPVVPKRHGLLIAPERARDPARFAAEFKSQQLALVRSARSERLAMVFPAPTEPATEERASLIRATAVVAAAKSPKASQPTFTAPTTKRMSRAQFARISGVANSQDQ